MIKILSENCTGCGNCVAICPVGALKISDGTAVVQDNCTLCGACVSDCPFQAIVLERKEAAPKQDLSSYKDIWVIAELENNIPKDITYELIGKARELSAAAGEKTHVVVLGSITKEAESKLVSSGADNIYLVRERIFDVYNTENYTQAYCQLINEYKPNAILVGATINGRDFAPRVASRLATGLCADCTALGTVQDNAKLIEWTRPAFGGNIMATILSPNHRPQMGTVRPKVFKISTEPTENKASVTEVTVKIVADELVKHIGFNKITEKMENKIEEAPILCSFGRGVSDEKSIALIREFAEIVGGTISCSRAVVDAGILDHSKQVGQSGKSVGPRTYFAFGISGAVQHLAGISNADIVIAINKDPRAPIFQRADYGIVGDAKDILPELIKQFTNR